MLAEKDCNPFERYLFSDFRYSDESIEYWQSECKNRMVNRDKDQTYNNFINWNRRKNEIAIFTMYAYADFKVPKTFNCIFEVKNPGNYIEDQFELNQSIWEGWFPIDHIEHGHKHLCILSFNDEVPNMLLDLYEYRDPFSEVPIQEYQVGIGHTKDIKAIIKRNDKVASLKNAYGKNWSEYDDHLS